MKINVFFRCWDCPKHTGVNGKFDTLNDALEHMRDYPNHILNVVTEVSTEDGDE